MHKFFPKFLFSILAFAIVSCVSDDVPDPKPQPEPEPEPVVATDLSRDEMANCYIVTAEGLYSFKADNQFNLGEGLPVPPEIHPEAAQLLWQTVNGSINYVELITNEDNVPYVQFNVLVPEGNAVIAVTDASGNIVWSWHIWMPAEEVSSVMTASGYEVMNMNLGAMNNTPGNASSYGMLYQWGRKDPFPAADTLTGTTSTVSAPMFDMEGNSVVITNSSWIDDSDNTLAYAVANPTVCLSNYYHYSTSRDWLRTEEADDALWGNPNGDSRDEDSNEYANKGRKTCYDPSPAGWRVPPVDVFRHFTSSGGYAWIVDDFNIADVNGDGVADKDDYNYGWTFLADEEVPLYFPAAARFDGSYAMLMGSMNGLWGNYWSNSPISTISGGAFCCLAFQVKDQNGNDMTTVSPAAGASRADAFSIRCIRDKQ